MSRALPQILFLASALIIASVTAAAEWTAFRGDRGLGASDETGLPAKWSEKENIAWRAELPGAGGSSPIATGDRVFVTCYSGYGIDAESPGEMDRLLRHVVALDRKTGSPLWSKEFAPALPESPYSGSNSTWHGYASSTPAVEAARLYVFFGKSGVYCLNASDGAELWHADVGSKTNRWGSGSSLVISGDLLIVNASVESESLLALDKTTGKEVWRTKVESGTRNTPLLVHVPGGETELVLSRPSREGWIVGYDPKTGQELWRSRGIPDDGYVCPSVVAHEGVVYAIGGRKNTAVAVKAGGRGDVTKTHEVWRVGKGSNVGSPVYLDGRLHWVHDGQGVAYCLDAKTGKVLYEKRLAPRPGVVFSSITAADGKLYAVSQHNGTFVLAGKPEFELLAVNSFADDDHRANASLAVSGGQILLRNDRHLYCLGAR